MKRGVLTLLVVVSLSAGAAALPAAPAHAGDRPFRVASDEARVSLSEAVAIVKDRYGDVTVLKAETKRRGDRLEHRIRFLAPGGRVKTVHVDAYSGEIR